VSRLRKMRLIVFDQFSYSFSIVFSLFLICCFNAYPGQAPQAQSGVEEHQRSPDTNLGSTRLANAICSCCISQVRFRSDYQIDNNNSRHGDQNPPNVTSPPHVRRIPYALCRLLLVKRSSRGNRVRVCFLAPQHKHFGGFDR
jgi:hypothetical protein